MLGIIIGVTSVIVMGSIGGSAQAEVMKKIRSLGTDLILVTAGQVRLIAGKPRQTGNVTTLVIADAKAIDEGADNIRALSPTQQKKMLVKYESTSTSTMVLGANSQIFEVGNWTVGEGRLFSEEEDKTLQKVVVLGKTVATSLFGQGNAIGARIQLGRVSFEVVGVLEPKGSDLVGSDQDDVVFIPLSTALRRVFNLTYVNNIYIRAVDSSVMNNVADQVGEILRERHRLRGRPDDFTIQNQSEIVKVEQDTSKTFQRLLSIIAGLSLLAGGAGIFAVMHMSVRERTKEIGLRRALGALRREVLIQFLVEAATLSVIGGLTGIFAGVSISVLIWLFTHWALVIPVSVIALTFCACVVMGVTFGFYPAYRASLLDPVIALKSE
ncbi:MAG: ABC transporter permease [Nitrospirae bacterium]|nr:ABC transporter permease [Nitrospirota bacterium]